MSIGELVIETDARSGRPKHLYLDGQRLPHACGFTITHTVGNLPEVTVSFRAVPTITQIADDGFTHSNAPQD